MTRFLVLVAAFLFFSWMLQRGLRSLAGRAAQHPLAQLLRLLLGDGGRAEAKGTGQPGQAARRLVRCERCGTHVPPERTRTVGGETVCDQCE